MYFEYYGLKEKPFSLSTDPKFLYYSNSHQAAFSKMIDTTSQDTGLMLLSGLFGTGKTTLMNALDTLTPRHWRKITIEDVVESIDQSELGFHQVRFKVDPFEKERKTSTKSIEIGGTW